MITLGCCFQGVLAERGSVQPPWPRHSSTRGSAELPFLQGSPASSVQSPESETSCIWNHRGGGSGPSVRECLQGWFPAVAGGQQALGQALLEGATESQPVTAEPPQQRPESRCCLPDAALVQARGGPRRAQGPQAPSPRWISPQITWGESPASA